MFFLFLTILSCDALKLADPIYLRDVDATEDNSSLRAWCQGTGCVMPFTPKSCLSWCDWNYDKQADAEARGAFGAAKWAEKKVLATDFYMILAANTGGACDAAKTRNEWFKQRLDADDKKIAIAKSFTIYPGGDKEEASGNTYLKCNECYIIQATGQADAAPALAQFSVIFTEKKKGTVGTKTVAGKASRVQFWQHSDTNHCSGTLKYEFDLDAFVPGAPRSGEALATQGPAWVGNGGACKVYPMQSEAKRAWCKAGGKFGNKQDKNDGAQDPAQFLCAADGTDGAKLVKKETPAAFIARKQCCHEKAAIENVGFGLSRHLAWPVCN